MEHSGAKAVISPLAKNAKDGAPSFCSGIELRSDGVCPDMRQRFISGQFKHRLLGGGASYYLDEVVEAEMAGEGFLDLIGGEFVVLLRRHDRFIQG